MNSLCTIMIYVMKLILISSITVVSITVVDKIRSISTFFPQPERLVVIGYLNDISNDYINEDANAMQKIAGLKGPKRVISNNPLLQKVTDFLLDHKVYISLTSSPSRLPKLHYMLETLDLENVEKVLIALPKRYGRNDEGYADTDIDALNASSKVEVIRIERDLGPITKLIPAVQYAESEDIIITVDDDIGYHTGMVNELIIASIMNDNTVVGGSGQDLGFWNIPYFSWPHNDDSDSICGDGTISSCHIIEGFAAVAYRPKYVDAEFMITLGEMNPYCFVSDDMVISYVLSLNGIRRKMISTQFYHRDHFAQAFMYGMGEDALHNGGGFVDNMAIEIEGGDINAQKYQRCYSAIQEYMKK